MSNALKNGSSRGISTFSSSALDVRYKKLKSTIQSNTVNAVLDCVIVALNYENVVPKDVNSSNYKDFTIVFSRAVRLAHHPETRIRSYVPEMLKTVFKPSNPSRVIPENCLNILNVDKITQLVKSDQQCGKYEMLQVFSGLGKFAEFEKLYYNVVKDKDKGQEFTKKISD